MSLGLTTQEEFAFVKAIIKLIDPETKWKNSDNKRRYIQFGNYIVSYSRFDKHFKLECIEDVSKEPSISRDVSKDISVPWTPFMKTTLLELIIIYDDKKYSKTRYKIGFEPMKLLYQELTSLYQRHFDKLLALTRKYCLEWTFFQCNPNIQEKTIGFNYFNECPLFKRIETRYLSPPKKRSFHFSHSFDMVVEEGLECICKDMFRISYIPDTIIKSLRTHALEHFNPLQLCLYELCDIPNDIAGIIKCYCGKYPGEWNFDVLVFSE